MPAKFDRRLISQALTNIIKNATEAIESVEAGDNPRSGRILVRASFDAEHNRFIADVIDNGRGLPVENRHRILEPYMTMREKGTGLGLAIVKKIIEEHGGHLELHDAPADFDHGHGAMIRVLLPHVEVAASEIDKEVAYGV
jgi:two-component system nitrogen regulation sensor histidine kinase NtrY